MFNEVIGPNKIPPNFLNSILTNPSLYDMFKNNFDENIEYFQNISKEEYLSEMLKFIEDILFSSNVYHIYSETQDLDEFAHGKLEFIKCFYDDFLLEEFNKKPENILNTRFFKGLEFTRIHDLYANKTKEFQSLYKYVFEESIDYFGITHVLLNEPLKNLKEKRVLSMRDFGLVCNYVKNNIDGLIDMNLATSMLHNHAYKTNHIFDPSVIVEIVKSIIHDYMSKYDLELDVKFIDAIEEEENNDYSSRTVFIDYKYIEGFISLNYVELFEEVFFKVNTKLSEILLEENQCDYKTLKNLMSLLVCKVDLNRIYKDESYKNEHFLTEAHAESFIASLKFFSSFGVNLFSSYIESKMRGLNIMDELEMIVSPKEISLDQKFDEIFKKCPNKKRLIKEFPSLGVIYNESGRLRLIDLIKKVNSGTNTEFIMEYLHSRIIAPEEMILDVSDLATFNTRIESIKDLIESQLKYIYVDTFYYSLNSYIKMQKLQNFVLGDYLDDLTIKVNCIKDTPLTHRFIDECLLIIDEVRSTY